MNNNEQNINEIIKETVEENNKKKLSPEEKKEKQRLKRIRKLEKKRKLLRLLKRRRKKEVRRLKEIEKQNELKIIEAKQNINEQNINEIIPDPIEKDNQEILSSKEKEERKQLKRIKKLERKQEKRRQNKLQILNQNINVKEQSKYKKNKNRPTLSSSKSADSLLYWKNKLLNEPCFIIGNSPAIKNTDLSVLDNYFTIGINRSFLKIDTTILAWQDLAIWSQERKNVLKTKSIKYCRHGASSSVDKSSGFYFFRLVGKNHEMTEDPTFIYGRGSSGPLAFQLAYNLGCNPIILLGMDCKKDAKGNTDFYGNNPMHRPFTLPACMKGLGFIKGFERDRNIISCDFSPMFENKMSLDDVLKSLGDYKPPGREELVRRITKK